MKYLALAAYILVLEYLDWRERRKHRGVAL